MKEEVLKAINNALKKKGSALVIEEVNEFLEIRIKDPLIESRSMLNLNDEVWLLIDKVVRKELGIKHDITYNNTGRIFWCYDNKGNKIF